jgi:2-dehydro-3-deoxygalactonokinase
MGSRFLACDWGTTNLRAWVLGADGRVEAAREFPLGVSKLQPGEAARLFREEVHPLMAAESLPAVLCGMIGSTLGWTVAPYLDCPIDLEGLRRGLFRVAEPGPPVWIVPGLKGPGVAGAPEVMRGEETQVFGWLAEDPARRRGVRLVCHPGTHAKWIVAREGRIERFLSAMTGELFAVLTRHSVLKTEAPAEDEDAFLAGCAAAGDGSGLATRLFTARTRIVAGDADPASAGAYLSGLLIGAEAASVPGLLGVAPGRPVALVGEPALCRWYALALERVGFQVETYDGDEAVLDGLRALQPETDG